MNAISIVTVFLVFCIVVIVMITIICGLWDTINGRWGGKRQIDDAQEDTDLFHH